MVILNRARALVSLDRSIPFVIENLPMVQLIEKIDKAAESKEKCTLIDKMGRYHRGFVTDSWIRISGGKIRGKLRFQNEKNVEVELDGNDILDLVIQNPPTNGQP